MKTSVHASESLLSTVIIEVAVMIVAARVMHYVFKRAHQPGVVGEIVAGLLLGPSLFGHFFPEISANIFSASATPTIVVMSQIGLILLMFQIGADFEFGNLIKSKDGAMTLKVGVLSIGIPFILGLLVGYYSHSYYAKEVPIIAYCLFIGVALAITAVPILGRILRQFNLLKTDVGLIAISAAALNDVVGWVLLAAIAAFAANKSDPTATSLQILGILSIYPIGRFIIAPIARYFVKHEKISENGLSGNMVAVTLIIAFGFALFTYKLGIFAIFGGFAAGIIFHSHHEFVKAWHKQVTQFVTILLLPIFFTFTGLRTNVLGLNTFTDWFWLAMILAAAILGKIVPIYLLARSQGFEPAKAKILAYLMNTRALMELIVLNVGYDLGVLPKNVFTMLTIMAIVTTIMTGPLLTPNLRKLNHQYDKNAEA